MALEEEDMELITKTVNEIVHKIVQERDKRFESRMTKKMEDTLGTKFDELKTLIMSDDDDDDNNDDKAPPNNRERDVNAQPGKLAPEVEAMIKQAQKDAKEAKDLAAKYQKEAEAERTAKMQTEELNALTQGLTGSVKGPLLEMVVKQLHGNIVRDPESKAILWKNADGEHLPLKDGLETWKKSEAGKEVAPPRDVRGSGSHGGGNGVPLKGDDMNMDTLGAILSGTIGR